MLDQTPEWPFLKKHQKELSSRHLLDFFKEDPERFNRFSLSASEIFLDYSKNRITEETISGLLALANRAKLAQKIETLLAGRPINFTEQKAAWHTILRDPNAPKPVKDALTQMEGWVNKLRNKQWRGVTGKLITDVVNIGIGGSDLGPKLVVDALRPYKTSDLALHFISGVDGHDLSRLLETLHPDTTLFILSSKSFKTQETLWHAKKAVKNWVVSHLGNQKVVFEKHVLAVTAYLERAEALGVPKTNILPLWDWVGGRFSVWSCIGLPIALSIGMEGFQAFLNGAHQMDEHFKSARFIQNMPVIMALLSIWNINFWQAHTQAVVPYAQALHLFPAYLQQLVMESNGKSVNQVGEKLNYLTAPIVWGGVGTDVQHSFFQLLYQGQHCVPVDFIATIQPLHDLGEHHHLLLANCFAQSQALMEGRAGLNMPAHQQIGGNQPSNTLLLDKLTPSALGSLMALYEHKTAVEGMIWGINSFDQPGVELGKKLARQVLEGQSENSSTKGLLKKSKFQVG